MRSANDCCELIWELSLPRHPAASLVTDAMLVATARNLDLVTIEPSPPIKVLLPRKAHPGDAALKKELGGDIVYGAQVAGLVYPLDFFARAVQQISGLLPAIGAFQSGDTSPAEMRISPFIARLSNTILTHLHRNGAPIETVASALFMSVRTLQRRLKEHGLSYQQVRTELRQSRSKKLLPQQRVKCRTGGGESLAMNMPMHSAPPSARGGGRVTLALSQTAPQQPCLNRVVPINYCFEWQSA